MVKKNNKKEKQERKTKKNIEKQRKQTADYIYTADMYRKKDRQLSCKAIDILGLQCCVEFIYINIFIFIYIYIYIYIHSQHLAE